MEISWTLIIRNGHLTTFFPLPELFLMLQRQSSSVLRANSLQEQGRTSKYAE